MDEWILSQTSQGVPSNRKTNHSSAQILPGINRVFLPNELSTPKEQIRRQVTENSFRSLRPPNQPANPAIEMFMEIITRTEGNANCGTALDLVKSMRVSNTNSFATQKTQKDEALANKMELERLFFSPGSKEKEEVETTTKRSRPASNASEAKAIDYLAFGKGEKGVHKRWGSKDMASFFEKKSLKGHPRVKDNFRSLETGSIETPNFFSDKVFNDFNKGSPYIDMQGQTKGPGSRKKSEERSNKGHLKKISVNGILVTPEPRSFEVTQKPSQNTGMHFPSPNLSVERPQNDPDVIIRTSVCSENSKEGVNDYYMHYETFQNEAIEKIRRLKEKICSIKARFEKEKTGLEVALKSEKIKGEKTENELRACQLENSDLRETNAQLRDKLDETEKSFREAGHLKSMIEGANQENKTLREFIDEIVTEKSELETEIIFLKEKQKNDEKNARNMEKLFLEAKKDREKILKEARMEKEENERRFKELLEKLERAEEEKKEMKNLEEISQLEMSQKITDLENKLKEKKSKYKSKLKKARNNMKKEISKLKNKDQMEESPLISTSKETKKEENQPSITNILEHGRFKPIYKEKTQEINPKSIKTDQNGSRFNNIKERLEARDSIQRKNYLRSIEEMTTAQENLITAEKTLANLQGQERV